MERSERWLRASYAMGAAVDGLAVLQLLIPKLFAVLNGLSDFRPSAEYTYAAGVGASLMLGWTALLLWAVRRPQERKGLLAITIVPVLSGLAVTELWAASSGFLEWTALTPTWAIQATLVAVFAYSYHSVGALEHEERRRSRDSKLKTWAIMPGPSQRDNRGGILP